MRPLFADLPKSQDGGLLTRYADSLAILVPAARENLVTNPSGETATTGYNPIGGSVARSATHQFHGAYSIAITPTSSLNDGGYYGTVSLTNGTVYAVSCKMRGAAGVPYQFSVRTTGAAVLASVDVVGTGRWQWVWLFWKETSSTARRLYWTKRNHASTAILYVDGVQVEACDSAGSFVTTYIDGDQRGLVPNQYPPAYLWTGVPHASTSRRSAQTRAGGRVVLLRDLGFSATRLIGLGLATPELQALTFAQLDGGQLQDIRKPARPLTIVGRFDADDSIAAAILEAQLARLFDRDRVARRQALVLTLQASDDAGRIAGEPCQLVATYAGGLEGEDQQVLSAARAISLIQQQPFLTSRDGGAALSVVTAIASGADYIVQRSAGGAWSAMGTGLNAAPLALLRSRDGTLIVGGTFTTAGGSAAAYIARWSGSAWATIGGAATFNNYVEALAEGPSGQLYAGGRFTNAGGIAAADYVAQWNGSAWSAMGAGANGDVYALAMAPNGFLYAGGAFTDIDGSGADYIAVWNLTQWLVVGSATALNGNVLALAVADDGTLYAGGNFTNAGGVAAADAIAKWDGAAWSALGTAGANAAVQAIVVAPNGDIYAGGTFTSIGGVAVTYVAVWNGSLWQPVGTLDGGVEALAWGADGRLYAAGAFTTADGVATPSGFAAWNGSSWTLVDIQVPGTPSAARAILPLPSGELYLGYAASGSATAAALTTVTHPGTAYAIPRVRIAGPTGAFLSSRIYQLVNVTTGAALYLDYTIQNGEVAVLDLDPEHISFTSTFQGNILSTILEGSNLTDFVLQPGDQVLSCFATNSTVEVSVSWTIRYAGLGDALYQLEP